jgi:hypothetical protein
MSFRFLFFTERKWPVLTVVLYTNGLSGRKNSIGLVLSGSFWDILGLDASE